MKPLKDRYEGVRRRERRYNVMALITFVVFSVLTAVVRLFFDPNGEGMTVAFFLSALFVPSLFMIAAVLTDTQAHELAICIAHIHDQGCTNHEEVTIVDRETHAEVSATSSGWDMGTPATVVDSETTECSVCKTRTLFRRDEEPRLLA